MNPVISHVLMLVASKPAAISEAVERTNESSEEAKKAAIIESPLDESLDLCSWHRTEKHHSQKAGPNLRSGKSIFQILVVGNGPLDK